ncbi:DUF397 domain-containing protein [Streptomyces sp. NPDC017529]|uniref:DUF397 domain-containing protein n=1 Tax=Streptomyces sp. NPDC017529 TaxID=3365000 RepID=UPI0037B228FB
MSLRWQTSSYCADSSNCLGLAAAPDGTVHIRESETPYAVVATNRTQVGSLIRVIKNGALPPGGLFELVGVQDVLGGV